jgi:hypothetical protein
MARWLVRCTINMLRHSPVAADPGDALVRSTEFSAFKG